MVIAPPAAVASLRGLAVGDAFGDQYFLRGDQDEQAIEGRWLAPTPWRWTDDTNMALSIFETLMSYGEIRPDELAINFAQRYEAGRGYGPSMHRVLRQIADGRPWQEVTGEQFEGQGSHGNGAAMRVAPLGAWFSADIPMVAQQAALSASVTHAHPEAVAGAVAVAVAAAARVNGASGTDLLAQARLAVEGTEVGSRLRRAEEIRRQAGVAHAVALLGNGVHLSAVDTVPFALWCAAMSGDNFIECMWLTVSGLGDRDTTCAIAGGVLAAGSASLVPLDWLTWTEPLPVWITV